MTDCYTQYDGIYYTQYDGQILLNSAYKFSRNSTIPFNSQVPSGPQFILFVYAPAMFERGIVKTKMDIFAVKKTNGKSKTLRMYIVAYGTMAYIELDMEHENRGSILTGKMVFEIPSSVSPDRMDLTFLLTRIPQLTQEKVLIIKKGVEGEG